MNQNRHPSHGSRNYGDFGLLQFFYRELKSIDYVYYRTDDDRNIYITLAYVNDTIFDSSNLDLLKSEISAFLNHFEGLEDPLKRYLGVNILIEEGTVFFYQKTCIKNLLRSFELENFKTYTITMASNAFDKIGYHIDDPVVDGEHYRNMIGSLQFLSSRLRPNVMTAVYTLDNYSATTTTILLKSLK